MKKPNNNKETNYSRRKFIQQSALLGAGIVFGGSTRLFADNYQQKNIKSNIASKGYAAKDSMGKLSPWSFERRSLEDNDVLIEIKFSGICHSDIHLIKGDWGAQQYPHQLPHN